MTKKKKLINALIFIGGLIVFLFYYFEDKGDMDKVEEKQDVSADSAAIEGLEALDADFSDFEESSTEDSVIIDSL